MVNSIKIKVCGITSVDDARIAANAGADYLGFVVNSFSPRYVSLDKFKAMKPDLPDLPKVGVISYSDHESLSAAYAAGFDFIQLLFCNSTPFIEVAMLTDVVPPEKLWMSPRIPKGRDLDLSFVPLADRFIFDCHQNSADDGRKDWLTLKGLRMQFQKVTWVASGGITPENIAGALAATGVSVIDVGAGVESAPGVLDPSKLAALQSAIENATCPA